MSLITDQRKRWSLAGRMQMENVMNVESLECENLDVNELSDTDLEQVAAGHRGSDLFTWGLIGTVGAVVGTAIVVGLFL
jgi:hypothetical protein